MSGRLVGLGLPSASGIVGACGYQEMCAVSLAERSPPSASTNMAQFPIVGLFLSAVVMRVVALPWRFSIKPVILGCLHEPRMWPWVSCPILQIVQMEEGVFCGFTRQPCRNLKSRVKISREICFLSLAANLVRSAIRRSRSEGSPTFF